MSTMTFIIEFFGRLHPLAVHFPIAFLVAGSGLEILRLKSKAPFLAEAALWCFAFGSVGALLAVGSGWSLEAHSHHPADELRLIELHEKFALATSISALAAFAAEFLWRDSAQPRLVWLRRLLACVTFGLVAATGHLGALAVWGGDWFR